MKLVFRSLCAIAVFALFLSAFPRAQAQIASATPDPFAIQLTSSPERFGSFAGDITANGRFVVFESNGNLDTQNPRNADANREIFLIDYAQRRIFQLTNTKNVPKPPASPSPTPTPTATPTPSPGASPSPTPTPVPTPADPNLIRLEISNNRPMISFEPELLAGKRTYTIVFSSNAPDPGLFDGVESTALLADGNQEIWIYQVPDVDEISDLSTGDDIPFTAATDLSLGTFRRITGTDPSRPIIVDRNPPDVVDDNRDATISDDGNTLAFISTRNILTGNADLNPEVFFCRTSDHFVAKTIVQGTATQNDVVGVKTFPRFQQNPSLSFNGNIVSFISTANLASSNDDDGAGHGNAEIYAADFTGSGLENYRQITKTKAETTGPNAGVTLNLLSAGRRLSRDGKFVAYQSRAEDPFANTGTNSPFLAPFVSDIPADAMTASTPKGVGPRAQLSSQIGDVINFPTFTDYDPSLSPHTVVYASALNIKPDGTFPSEAEDSTGLNPAPTGIARPNQVYATQVPITSSNTFTRLTKNPVDGNVTGIRPLASNTRKRVAFTLGAVELGGGNGDSSSEVFYLLSPTVSTESAALLSFFTGATFMGPFASETPSASPTPTPTATPTPSPGIATGLAPGELSSVRSTVGLADSDKTDTGGAENARRPILPVELNGVSVSVGGAAAGLYFVGDSPAEGITFVVPIGLTGGVKPVVVNNRGTVFRGFLLIVPSQPDIFNPPTNGPGGVAMACNVTATGRNGSGCIVGPFKVTTDDGSGTQVPTQLEIWTTGNRLVLPAEARVSFIAGGTTTDVTPSLLFPNTNKFGFDLITITLPASLAGMAPIDYKVVVTVTRGGGPLSSRPEADAPTITIIP